MEKEKKYTELYTDHYKKVWQVAYRFTNCRSSAEDITQEVFVKLWQQFDLYSQISDLSGYLFIVTRNSSFNYCKARTTRRKHTLQYLQSLSLVHNDDSIMHREADKILMQMISELPEREREIFTLVVDEGNSRQVVSRHLNIRPNTVKSTISHVRVKFTNHVNRRVNFWIAPKTGKRANKGKNLNVTKLT